MKTRSKLVKYAIVIVLILFIAIVAYYLYANRDVMFTSKVEIRYPDNCVEVYHNGVIMSPNCTEGRRMLEEQQNKDNPKWVMNITLDNQYQR